MTESYTITFETKCYENDWQYILKGTYLDQMIKRCGIAFDRKQLIINNVKNRQLVASFAEIKKQQGIIDSYYFTDDTETEVLSFFKTPKETFGKGYVYSISELTGIYMCTTDYLLHFSSDTFLCRSARKSNWIQEAVQIFTAHPDIIIAVPVWNHLKKAAAAESYGTIENFYVCQGISDQCYFIPLRVFKADIYNTKHPYSERYPAYGGELFEKRVDAFMRNNDLYRIVYKKTSYIHGNFPQKKWKKHLYWFLAKKMHFEFTTLCRDPGPLKRLKDICISYYKTLFKKYKNMSHRDLAAGVNK